MRSLFFSSYYHSKHSDLLCTLNIAIIKYKFIYFQHNEQNSKMKKRVKAQIYSTNSVSRWNKKLSSLHMCHMTPTPVASTAHYIDPKHPAAKRGLTRLLSVLNSHHFFPHCEYSPTLRENSTVTKPITGWDTIRFTI